MSEHCCHHRAACYLPGLIVSRSSGNWSFFNRRRKLYRVPDLIKSHSPWLCKVEGWSLCALSGIWSHGPKALAHLAPSLSSLFITFLFQSLSNGGGNKLSFVCYSKYLTNYVTIYCTHMLTYMTLFSPHMTPWGFEHWPVWWQSQEFKPWCLQRACLPCL